MAGVPGSDGFAFIMRKKTELTTSAVPSLRTIITIVISQKCNFHSRFSSSELLW